MLYNSYIFLMLFLPLTLIVYQIVCKTLPKESRKIVLLLASACFVAYSGIYHFAILAISICVNYILTLFMERKKKLKLCLILGLLFNVLFLIVFKYTDFIIRATNTIFSAKFKEIDILLPLGISFYTFQQIAWIVDHYKQAESEHTKVLNYALSVSFFPKILEGPIVDCCELQQQLDASESAKFNFDAFASGIYIFAIGLAKKVLIADNFGTVVDYGFGNITTLTGFETLLVILGYSLQLYFDFSGYCDMAIGVARLFNIELPINFNSPYKATSIDDFWKRWHITLTRFLTKYIYIPLGGNRRGKSRTYANVLIVFLISGIWHGAGFTFIIWGILHGAASVLHRIFKTNYNKVPKVIKWLLTFCFVSLAWVVFRASTVHEALGILQRLFAGGWSFTINAELTESLRMNTFISLASQVFPFTLVVLIGYAAAVLSVVFCRNSNEMMTKFKPSVMNLIISVLLVLLSMLSLSGVSSFLYVNF